MPFPDLYKKLENERGQQMRDILRPLLNTLGIQKTAKHLGVSDTTVTRWAARAGVCNRWVASEECDERRSA